MTTTLKISAAEVRPDYAAYNGVVLNEYGYDATSLPKVSDLYRAAAAVETVEVSKAELEMEKSKDQMAMNDGDESADGAVASRPVRTGLQRKNSMEFWLNENQKPPVSARFGHRKSVKASPHEGMRSLPISLCKRLVVICIFEFTDRNGRRIDHLNLSVVRALPKLRLKRFLLNVEKPILASFCGWGESEF